MSSQQYECCKSVSYHSGKTEGSVIELDGRKTYVTGSQDSKVAILIIADVWGYSMNNTRILADQYAQGVGARVYIPDFFNGEDLFLQTGGDESKRAGIDMPSFIAKYHPRDAAFPQVESVAKAIKAAQPGSKLGVVGFCWGAPGTLHLGSDKPAADIRADAIAFAHPSVVEMSDFENLTKPGLFLTAEHDQMLPPEKRDNAIQITRKLAADKDLFTKWVLYPKVVHGFATRGEQTSPFALRAMRDASAEVVTFFRTELASN